MATFRYDGESERVFPSIRVTVSRGGVFEAPEDFTAPDVVAVNNSTKPSAPAVEPSKTKETKSAPSDKIAGE